MPWQPGAWCGLTPVPVQAGVSDHSASRLPAEHGLHLSHFSGDTLQEQHWLQSPPSSGPGWSMSIHVALPERRPARLCQARWTVTSCRYHCGLSPRVQRAHWAFWGPDVSFSWSRRAGEGYCRVLGQGSAAQGAVGGEEQATWRRWPLNMKALTLEVSRGHALAVTGDGSNAPGGGSGPRVPRVVLELDLHGMCQVQKGLWPRMVGKRWFKQCPRGSLLQDLSGPLRS